jgi:hypothetical protein
VDRQAQEDRVIRLADDGRAHAVRVVLGGTYRGDAVFAQKVVSQGGDSVGMNARARIMGSGSGRHATVTVGVGCLTIEILPCPCFATLTI